MKYVVIVNGKPGSGKTTFEHFCRDYLNDMEYAQCHILSTIDPIKDIYRKLGWDGEKTDKARKELSILKKMWIDNCNGPLKYIVESILKFDKKDDHVIFVDIREESEIIALRETLSALELLDIRCTTLLIKRRQAEDYEYGNKSDDGVGQNESLYITKIYNGGDNLDEFRDYADMFIEDLFKGEN